MITTMQFDIIVYLKLLIVCDTTLLIEGFYLKCARKILKKNLFLNCEKQLAIFIAPTSIN